LVSSGVIAAGKLRDRVRVQRVAETRAADGGIVETWTDIGRRWAQVQPLAVREYLQAQQVEAEITHRIVMRKPSLVTAKDRLIVGSRTFEVVGVMEDAAGGDMAAFMAKETI
jgi:SPP1 family predicted phage head-tail adaptor